MWGSSRRPRQAQTVQQVLYFCTSKSVSICTFAPANQVLSCCAVQPPSATHALCTSKSVSFRTFVRVYQLLNPCCYSATAAGTDSGGNLKLVCDWDRPAASLQACLPGDGQPSYARIHMHVARMRYHICTHTRYLM
jgi:hypothetical protein